MTRVEGENVEIMILFKNIYLIDASKVVIWRVSAAPGHREHDAKIPVKKILLCHKMPAFGSKSSIYL